MRTIDKLLPYTLTEDQKSLLRQAGIINGVGGQGNSIENLVETIYEVIKIRLEKEIDTEKLEQLWKDIKELAICHDVEFYFQLGFYRANFRFAKRLFYLLHWAGAKRFLIFIICYIILNKYGKQFYAK